MLRESKTNSKRRRKPKKRRLKKPRLFRLLRRSPLLPRSPFPISPMVGDLVTRSEINI